MNKVMRKFKPLISIIVPQSESEDGTERIANVRAQSWQNREIITVSDQQSSNAEVVTKSGSSLIHMCNEGYSHSQGDYICFLLPGVRFNADKLQTQVDYLAWNEIEDVVIYSNYSLLDRNREVSKKVELPNLSPENMLSYLYGAHALHPSALLLPRKALELLKQENGACFREDLPLALAMVDSWMFLCRQINFLWLAQDLMTVKAEKSSTSSVARNFYSKKLPTLLDYYKNHVGSQYNIISLLGDAFAARIEQHYFAAAWDVLLKFFKEWRQNRFKPGSLRIFGHSFLRLFWHKLPEVLKKCVKKQTAKQDQDNTYRLDFDSIYQDNGFIGTESLSGLGSTMLQTRIVRRELPQLLQHYNICSMLDVPCGDFHWMNQVDLNGISYIGGDIVSALVDANQQRFGKPPERTFLTVNLIQGSLPEAELIFCRDCLVHLPFTDIFSALESICNSKAEWLLVTTFPELTHNVDFDESGWRSLNLELPPFNFPSPDELLYEKCTEAGGRFRDKALGLWKISKLRECEWKV